MYEVMPDRGIMLVILSQLVILFVAVVVVEFFIRGRKLQNALTRTLPVFCVAGFVGLVLSLVQGCYFVFGILLFWGGSFLAWFGVRSHLESSILLWMLVYLRKAERTEAEISTVYLQRYGPAERLEELHTGGLIERMPGGEIALTRKGQQILRIATLLGR